MLIQASQQMAMNPGPLGHFFRRLKQRKNHNVAVVATARKLVMVAWHMLRKNEPYRYALPGSTGAKLASLRVRVTGEKRKAGPPKGTRANAKLPGGSRTIKSLDRVYAEEGVPVRTSPTVGEQRVIVTTECATFVADLKRDHVVPRKRKPATQEEQLN